MLFRQLGTGGPPQKTFILMCPWSLPPVVAAVDAATCGLKGGGRGLWLGPPSSYGPPMVPAKGGPKLLKHKSSWHRRRLSKILAVSLKHWKGRTGGTPLLLRRTAVPIHRWGWGGGQVIGAFASPKAVPSGSSQRVTSTAGTSTLPVQDQRWLTRGWEDKGGVGARGGWGWHKALVVGSVSLWRRLLASRP